MAIDTVDKRRSVAGMAPIPDGTLATPDFQQIAGLYSGITIAAIIAIGLTGPFGAIFVDPGRMATLTEPARQGIFIDPARGATHKRG